MTDRPTALRYIKTEPMRSTLQALKMSDMEHGVQYLVLVFESLLDQIDEAIQQDEQDAYERYMGEDL